MLFYRVADIFFLLLHTGWIAFILLGWISRRTRPAHLVVCVATALSWSLLGLFYGWGYCPFTEWHWQARAQLSNEPLPHSYLTFLIERMSGIVIEGRAIDLLALVPLILAFLLSVSLWTRDRRRTG